MTPAASQPIGVIDAIGAGVDGFAPGQAVTIFPGMSPLPFGTYGELIIAPADRVIAQPANLSATQAAALWIAYLTAYAPMVEIAKVGPGDVVLLNAATSSVGAAAIHIVNHLGGVSVAMTRDRAKAERLKAIGAAHVIVTGEDDYLGRVQEITGGKLADIVFDPVSGPGIELLLQGVRNGGMLIQYGGLSGQPTIVPGSVMMRNQIIAGYAALDIGTDAGRRERAVRFITEGVASGALRAIVDRTFPIEEAAAAHAALESNQHVGKIVLVTNNLEKR